MTRILIADDSPPMRCGLRAFLELNSDWQVCGEAVDGADAVKEGTPACSRFDRDGFLDAGDGWRRSRPRDRQIGYRHSYPALQSAPVTSNDRIGSPWWYAGCDVKSGIEQDEICDQGASAW